jgi:uncharacterized membrane protein YhaH (DUF805 family)
MKIIYNVFMIIVLIANIIFAIIHEPSKLITVLAWISSLAWFLTALCITHDKEKKNEV